MQKTPFYQNHLNCDAKIVDFAGFALPINYGSQIKEHELVRSYAGMFDVSHMQITDIHGLDSKIFLQKLLSNDVAKLEPDTPHPIFNKALYSVMLNQHAGIIDDLIIYHMPFGYRIISNAATKIKDLKWIKNIGLDFDIKILPQDNKAMLAIQGPQAINIFAKTYPQFQSMLAKLPYFCAFTHDDFFIARTGYTGEDGLEIIVPSIMAESLWTNLYNNKVTPCGLGARDTLRLEAGMNLYGHDMNENTLPSECGLNWVVDIKNPLRNFIGKDAYLLAHQEDTNGGNNKNIKPKHKIQTGVILQGKGVLREGQTIFFENNEIGYLTSGTFSPTLKASIGIARIDQIAEINQTSQINQPHAQLFVKIRENLEPITIVKLPFVKKGKIMATML
ncbi:MAG: glycine cleavage system aminomethyltransferase GcvT [Bacteroidia bacterium]|nr:MAG: glycine cleavage system aminomethyltransferase GcvT [Bacteroidia bacterium]